MGQAEVRLCPDAAVDMCAESRPILPLTKSGYSVGELVYFSGARQHFQNGDELLFGMPGEILGDSESEQDHIRVHFRGHKDFTNARCSDLSRQPPVIPGDFEVGDRVFWSGEAETFESGDRLRFGLAGEVVGRSSQGGRADEACLAVHFDGNAKITDVLLTSVSKACGSANGAQGCMPGERVYFKGARQVFNNGDRLAFGISGKVISIKNNKTCAPYEIRMAVLFDGNKVGIPVSITQLSRTPPTIPGGYEVGDVVLWKGKAQTLSSGDRLDAGTMGEVVGQPCARFDGRDDERVLVQFEGHRHTTPCLLCSVMRRSGL